MTTKTEKAMRDKVATIRNERRIKAGQHLCCGAPLGVHHLRSCVFQVTLDTSVQVPPDKDKLARWQGDHAALLARLQETYSELWLQRDLDQKKGEGRRHRLVGRLISAAVEHFGRMP